MAASKKRNATDYIVLKRLRVDCIIGIYPHELHKLQPVIADVRLGMDLSRAGKSGKINATYNYELIAREITELLKFRRYRLLEAAAEEICAMLFGVHPRLQSVQLVLEKPKALLKRAQAAAIEITRYRRDYAPRRETASFGEVEILFENEEAGLYLLHIQQKKEIPPHFHRVMRELEWRVRGRILRNGVPLSGLSPVAWAREERHGYQNVGSRPATLFCCDVPKFIPDDEIPVRAPETEASGPGRLGPGDEPET